MSTPVVCACFDAQRLRLALAVRALDLFQVRVQSTSPGLSTALSLKKDTVVTALAWVQDLVAVCTAHGAVLIYSPSENRVVAELEASTHAITHFHHLQISGLGWAADASGTVYEWDVETYSLVNRFRPDVQGRISRLSLVLLDGPHLIVATNSVYLVDIGTLQITREYTAHVEPISDIVVCGSTFVTCAEGDRYINMYHEGLRAVLVAEHPVRHVAMAVEGGSCVAAVVENGTLEIFNDVLRVEAPKKRRGAVTRSSDAVVKVSRPKDEIRGPGDECFPVDAVALGAVLHVSWLEQQHEFAAVPWLRGGEYVLRGSSSISAPRRQAAGHVAAGEDVAAAQGYVEAAVVTQGNAFQDDVEELLAEKLEKLSERAPARVPSVGTLLVVLAQALRNGDQALLESVLAEQDARTVQHTLQRLGAALAVVLAERLTEKLSRGANFEQWSLWLKWLVIVHGGVLASGRASTRLASLRTVLGKRMLALPRLLELQGRLTMLSEQTALKREILNGTAEDAADVEYVEELDDAAHELGLEVELDVDVLE